MNEIGAEIKKICLNPFQKKAALLSLTNKTPDVLMLDIAEPVTQRWLEKRWTQKMLAIESGISLASQAF